MVKTKRGRGRGRTRGRNKSMRRGNNRIKSRRGSRRRSRRRAGMTYGDMMDAHHGSPSPTKIAMDRPGGLNYWRIQQWKQKEDSKRKWDEWKKYLGECVEWGTSGCKSRRRRK